MVYTRVLEARAERRGGSSPLLGTTSFFRHLAHHPQADTRTEKAE